MTRKEYKLLCKIVNNLNFVKSDYIELSQLSRSESKALHNLIELHLVEPEVFFPYNVIHYSSGLFRATDSGRLAIVQCVDQFSKSRRDTVRFSITIIISLLTLTVAILSLLQSAGIIDISQFIHCR